MEHDWVMIDWVRLNVPPTQHVKSHNHVQTAQAMEIFVILET